MYHGRREFRFGRALVLLSVASTVLFAALAFWTYRTDGWTWMSVGASGLILLGVGGIAESLVARIELTDDALIVTNLRGTRRYAVTEIDRIEEARGTTPAVLLKDGRWVRLPAAGSSVGNSIRAWLRIHDHAQ
jgi:hypothetical protein